MLGASEASVMSVYNLSYLHILSTLGLLSPKHLQVDNRYERQTLPLLLTLEYLIT